jgi:ABC-2 type transport system permease protein
MKPRIISAIIRRELTSYFSSPTGYVFITIFIFLSAFAAFWLPGFFGRNLATLDQLNQWFPALMLLLVPAITMGAWAEERKQGTEELLLTLPARDWQLVVGKYLACVLIYSVALVFSLSNVAVLALLGRPDIGLLLATYLGYWLCGAGLIAVGLVGSALTTNLTVAFITSATLCGLVVGAGALESIMPGTAIGSAAAALSLPQRMDDFGRGVIGLDNVAYFVLLAVLGLWANTLLVARRHWNGAKDAPARSLLAIVRGGALIVAAVSLVTILARTSARADATAERLWSLSPETRRLVREVPADKPVLVTAYVSPKVPASFTQTRQTLLGLLRELERAEGGGRVIVRVVDTEPFTEEAREAKRNFNIEPRTVPASPEDEDLQPDDLFMGVAVVCGAEQVVLPFISRGTPVEYELARSIRTVSLGGRKKVGVYNTDAGLFGSFDFNTFTSKPDWPIVTELRKQYEVVQIPKDEPIEEQIDVLIVAQPSTLTDGDLGHVIAYIESGGATLILEDPLPMVDPGLATSAPRDANMNPFQRQRAPQQPPKADLNALWRVLGVEVPADRVMWDSYNPRPQFGFEREIVFVSRNAGAPAAFNESQPVTSGLQEVVAIMAGEIRPLGKGREGVSVTNLMSTGSASGYVNYSEILQRGFFGIQGLNRARRQIPTTGAHVIAARLTGGAPAAPAPTETDVAGPPVPKPLNVLLISDLDMISPAFFSLRESGAAEFNFDNITFFLNAVDTLVGDESLVELRKRRPLYRTLERLDAARRGLEIRKDEAVDAANSRALAELDTAQKSLEKKVQEIQQRTDLDETTRGIMIESVRQAEQRRLDVQKAAIEDKKEAEITEARTKARQEIEAVQMNIRLAAVLLPPVPALFLGTVVLVRRRASEKEGVARERLR